MSIYRCLVCGAKGDEYDDFIEPTQKDIKESEWSIEGSSYQWLVCSDCFLRRKK